MSQQNDNKVGSENQVGSAPIRLPPQALHSTPRPLDPREVIGPISDHWPSSPIIGRYSNRESLLQSLDPSAIIGPHSTHRILLQSLDPTVLQSLNYTAVIGPYCNYWTLL